MSSKKLLTTSVVNQLYGSVLRYDSSCQICSTLSSKRTHLNGHVASRAQRIRSYTTTQINALARDNNRNIFHVCKFDLPKGPINRRFSSNSNSTSLKRDASTQAQQQQPEDSLKYHDSFRSSELEIVKCPPSKLSQKLRVDELVFGHVFTDHMFRVDWDHENGWSTPLISKVHNLDIHPGAKVLHYALEAFEGAKAFRGYDNKIRFFRLEQNIKRLINSARRLSLPEFDEDELIECIHRLVQVDQDWIPKSNGQQQLASMYVRPTILGVEPSLGVASSKKSILYVLLSPVGPYFKTGFKPISLYADPSFVRAWPGGAGNTKLGSNYAPTIMVQKYAEQLGLQQVLWLYGDDMKLTEVGTMNVFVSFKAKETDKLHLVTPPLNDGLILPGITRSSILELARQWADVVCEERYLTMGEIQQLAHEGRLVEMFGAGTACVVCPISSIQMKDGTRIRIPYFDITDTSESSDDSLVLTRRILKAITDIQYGKIPHHWAEELRYPDSCLS